MPFHKHCLKLMPEASKGDVQPKQTQFRTLFLYVLEGAQR